VEAPGFSRVNRRTLFYSERTSVREDSSGEDETGEHGVGGLTSLCFGRAQDRETIKTCLRHSRLYWPKDLNLRMQFQFVAIMRDQ